MNQMKDAVPQEQDQPAWEKARPEHERDMAQAWTHSTRSVQEHRASILMQSGMHHPYDAIWLCRRIRFRLVPRCTMPTSVQALHEQDLNKKQAAEERARDKVASDSICQHLITSDSILIAHLHIREYCHPSVCSALLCLPCSALGRERGPALL